MIIDVCGLTNPHRGYTMCCLCIFTHSAQRRVRRRLDAVPAQFVFPRCVLAHSYVAQCISARLDTAHSRRLRLAFPRSVLQAISQTTNTAQLRWIQPDQREGIVDTGRQWLVRRCFPPISPRYVYVWSSFMRRYFTATLRLLWYTTVEQLYSSTSDREKRKKQCAIK